MAPNEKYPMLDSAEICPKCGTDFFEVGKDPDMHYGCKSTNDAAGNYSVWDEWIRRTCPVCEFQWRENVWDGADKA